MPDVVAHARWSRPTGRCTRRPPRRRTSSSASCGELGDLLGRGGRDRAAVHRARRDRRSARAGSPMRVLAQNMHHEPGGCLHRRGLDPDAGRGRGRAAPSWATPSAASSSARPTRRWRARCRRCSPRACSPMLCVGETEAERDGGETEAVLRRQLDADLAEVEDADLGRTRDRLRADLGDRDGADGDAGAGRRRRSPSSARCSPTATTAAAERVRILYGGIGEGRQRGRAARAARRRRRARRRRLARPGRFRRDLRGRRGA